MVYQGEFFGAKTFLGRNPHSNGEILELLITANGKQIEMIHKIDRGNSEKIKVYRQKERILLRKGL